MIDLKTSFDAMAGKTNTIHCITSPLASTDTANVLLSLNQAPIMAEYKEEVADITKGADGLLVNLGTINENKLGAIGISLKSANKNTIPTVLDPVGASASKVRLDSSLYYLKKFNISILKGNYSEIYSIYHKKLTTKGVDSRVINESEIVEIAKALATQHNTIVVATGKHDIITDGFDTYLLKNGDAKLSKVTATGCLAGAMITAAYSHREDLASIILALSILNISAEMADKDAGMASFKISLLDKISLIDIAEIEERISYEKL